jgi:hypothetical protein
MSETCLLRSENFGGAIYVVLIYEKKHRLEGEKQQAKVNKQDGEML